MRILKLSSKNFKEIIKITTELIGQGKVIVYPTDTVYGLVCDATNKKAIQRLFKIKKRPLKKSIPIFVKDIKMAKKFAKIDKKQERFLRKSWPGKITTILKSEIQNLKFKIYGVDKRTIALRIPNQKLVLGLLKEINKPLSGTSANVSDRPASTKIKEVLKQFENQKYQPDLVIDAGNLPKSKPSTILDLTTEPPKILRI